MPVMPAQAGIQVSITGECIWIPACAGMTKDAIHPRFKKQGILAYQNKGVQP
jgi:hypothetical protein